MPTPDLTRGVSWIGGGDIASFGGLYFGCGQGAWCSDFASYGMRVSVDGYIDRLSVGITANAKESPLIWELWGETLAVPSALLDATLEIPAGATGTFVSPDDQVTFVEAGTIIRPKASSLDGPSNLHAFTVQTLGFRFTPADSATSVSTFQSNEGWYAGGGTGAVQFYGILGQQAYVADEWVCEYRVGATNGAVAKNIQVLIDNNALDFPVRVYLRHNGADTGVYVDIDPSDSPGWLSGVSDFETIAFDDRIDYRVAVNEAETGQVKILATQIDLITTDGSWFGGLGQQGRSIGVPRDFVLCGMNNFDMTTSAINGSLVTAPLNLRYVGIIVTDNSKGAATTLDVYKNGVFTGDRLSLAPGITGHQYMTPNVLASPTAPVDELALKLTPADGSGTFAFSVIDWSGANPLVPQPPTGGIIGELAWIHRTRRLPADGSIVRETYSDEDMHCPAEWQNGFKAGKVLQFGEAERVASDPVRGEWRGSTWTVRYSDTDCYFREQSIDATDRYAQDGQGLMTTRENRAVLGSPFTIFTGGFVSGRPVNGLEWEEVYGDAIALHKRANQTDLLPWRVLGDSFIMNPDEFSVVAEGLDLMTPEPIIYGRHIRVPDVDAPSEQGFVFPPIYLGIETIDGVDKHVWMIAGHACAAITDLRVDLTEVFSDPEWEIPGIGGFPKYEDRRSVTFGNLRRYSLLRAPVTDLLADEASLTNPDACALRVKQLAVAVEGIEPNGDGTGDVILDRLLAYLHYEQNFGQRKGQDSYQTGAWLPTPTWIVFDTTTPMLDEASYATCSAIALERFPVDGYIVAAIIGARPGDRRPRAHWKAAWNRSCSTRSGPTNLGADRVFMLHPTEAIKAAAPLYTDATEILDGTFEPDVAWDQQQTRLTFVCDPRHDSGEWATTDTLTDPDAIRDYGERDIPGETREYDSAPGITQATHLALLELARVKHPPRPVTLAAKVRPDVFGDSLGERQLGDYVRYKHVESIGTSRTQIRLMQIDRIRISPSGRYVIAQGFDVEDYIGYDAPAEVPEPSTNDTCAEAIAIDPTPSTPYIVTVDTTAAVEDTGIESELPEGYTANHPGWWTVTPAVDGARLFLSTIYSSYDTILAVFTGSCGALTRVQFNDNDGFRTTSVLDFEVVNGTTYYILAAGVGPDDGGSLTFSAQVYVPE